MRERGQAALGHGVEPSTALHAETLLPPCRCLQGALASRMSHSCTPNCQAIVMACGGRLTIALYTLRHVYEGKHWRGGEGVARQGEVSAVLRT